MSFDLPTLPYDRHALEPHMSADTLEFHHGKHHKGYVDKLNKALENARIDGLALEEIIQRAAKDEASENLFNNAAQSWNHEFFWKCLTPNGGGAPDGPLSRQIDTDFGSFDKFREAFKTAATGQFGSGWAWLVVEGGRLKVVTTANADTPVAHGQHALLTCDVWEHAYYLDYKNDRAAFIDTFLDKLVNWTFAAEQFANQGEGSTVAARQYQDAQKEFAQGGDVDDGARAAADALNGDEASELEKARRDTAA